MSPLVRLLIEAKSLVRQCDCAAARAYARREQRAIPEIEGLGAGRAHAVRAIRALMIAASQFSDVTARRTLCEGLDRIVDAVRLERDPPTETSVPYWVKDSVA